MHTFMQTLTEEQGLSEQEARELTGGLLWVIAQSADPEVFKQAAEEIIDAREYMKEGEQYRVDTEGDEIRGGKPAEEGALGADVGDAIHVGVILKMAGIDPEDQSEVLNAFVDALKESIDPSLVGMIRGQVRGLWDI
jgi:hypothetical protein